MAIDDTTDDRPGYDLESWRSRVPALRNSIPLANCSHAPETDVTRAAIEAYADSWDRSTMDWDGWMDQVDRAKGEFARLINADPDEIALAPSVSTATATLASCFDFDAGRDRVLLSGAEFPTIGHVWLAQEQRGARVDWVPMEHGEIRLEAYERRLSERTLLVAATHAFYRNGFRQDTAAIGRMAHAHGALLFVDAYQTLGLEPVDVRADEIDFLTGGAHKFLMGIPGIAFLYVRRSLISGLRPSQTGWFGRDDIFAFDPATLDWAENARRFEAATPPVVNAFVARAGIAMINEIGPERISRWTGRLGRRLVDGGGERGLPIYGPTGRGSKTATTAFVCPGDSMAVERALRERGVIAASRGEVIRLAPHFFNNEADVDTALDHLAELIGPGATDR